MLEVILASERRRPVEGAADHLPEPDPAGGLGQRGHGRPALEHGLIGRFRHVVEVVVDPDRVVPRRLGGQGDLLGLGPLGLGVGNADELPLPALRGEHAESNGGHGLFLSLRGTDGRDGTRIEGGRCGPVGLDPDAKVRSGNDRQRDRGR